LDLNQTLRNTLIDKSSREIKSLPLGHDRFGGSYWFFMVRIFISHGDDNLYWIIIG
jgi:hypothetical protein